LVGVLISDRIEKMNFAWSPLGQPSIMIVLNYFVRPIILASQLAEKFAQISFIEK